MKTLEEMIKDNIDSFENAQIPQGHKERFLKKLNSRRRVARREFIYRIAAAFLIFAGVSVPWIIGGDSDSYLAKIERESSLVYTMAEKLDPVNKHMVINTLDQLVTEAVPFADQLPDNLDSKTRREMKKRYYSPKIEGIDKLKGYVSELLDN